MNITQIEAAAARLQGHARVTPLLSSPFLDEIAGRRVFVKAECLQHTGSFKYRGAYSALSALATETRAQGVIAFSSGNHAQGVAYAARQHGVPAVIIMPSDAPKLKIANTRAYGAEVVLYDRATEDRDAIGDALARERGLTLIKPFDNAEVIAGQGTIGLEIAEQFDGAAQVLTGVFARKPEAVTDGLDAWAWDAPSRYLVGYGMDDAGKMRGLPFIGAIKGA